MSGKASPAIAQASDSQRSTVQSTPPWKRPILPALLLVLVTAALYSPVHHHPFVNYDDDVYVTANDHVKHGLHRGNLRSAFKWAMTTYDAANWHPVTWFSHMLDYRLFGDKASGHHDINLLLHVVNVALTFWVLMRATGRAGPSLMVAALFALHPINAETVAWIAERKNLLSMMFFLLTLGAWGWYAHKPRWQRYLAVVFLFALGLMAKPQVVTLPFVLLLWDYWPLERMFAASLPASFGRPPARSLPWLLLEKLPLLALSAGSAVLTIKAQWKGGGFNPDYTLFQRMENAAVCYVRSIGKALWPSRLALLYPHPGSSLRAWHVGLAVLALISISALVLRFRQRRYLVVGWLWFLGTLVPMIGLVQVGRQAMADRYAYLPFIGLFIMVCWGIADSSPVRALRRCSGQATAALTRVPGKRRLYAGWGGTTGDRDGAEPRQLSPAVLVVPACVILLVLAGLTRRQIGYWSDDITLWTHTVQVTSGNYVAEDNLGDALLTAGRPDDAQTHFLRAAEIYPSYPPTLMSLAVHNQREGRLREAIAQYQTVITETQNAAYQNGAMRAKAFTNMGHAYRDLGELAPARDSLQAAVDLTPGSFQAWLDLGIVSQQIGDLTAAIHAYYQAVRVKPFDVGYLLLAQALKRSGHKIEAEWAEQKAKDLTANYQRAQEAAAKMVQP